MKNVRLLLLIAIACLSSIATYAHDFEINGIYYNITNSANKEVEVTFKGDFYDSYEEYSGSVVIPGTVTYIGTTYSVTSIGNKALYDCSGLTSITIPESITSIGNYAFWGCTGLTSITIPESVTIIGEGAFWGCTGLTSITIPESVTIIGEKAFSVCSGLTNIVVENGNTNYDSRENCNAIIETSTNTLIVGCKNTIIPESVTSIGDYAFYGCSGLSSITIPNSVTSIGNYAFRACTRLTSITIPNSVTSIGTCAFYYCSGLTSVTIPNSVTSIGEQAFRECCGLTSITIPNSVTSIGTCAFYYCSGLTSIVVENGNTNYDSRENCNAIIETSTNTLIAGCKNTIIPESVTSIGDYAFYGCSGLTSIAIPNSVTSIGLAAFCICTDLECVTIGNSVTSIGEGAFEGCRSLTSVTIGNSVTSIGEQAFYGCIGLISIAIPNSVTSIGEYAFLDCSGLTRITIPESVTSIGLVAFSGCNGLTSIKVESGNSVYDSRDNCNAIIETATNTLITGCKRTIIPNSVTSIGEYAFYECSGLTSVEIPNSVTSIGEGAFYDCICLTSVTIGNSVTSIGNSAFANCSGLKEVNISDLTAWCNIDFKGNYVSVNPLFYAKSLNLNGNEIKDLVIPEGITEIKRLTFPGSNILSVTIPNSVTSIGEYAFYKCSGLTSVEIPNSVTSIGDEAFAACSSLETIYSFAVEPPICYQEVFYGVNTNSCELYVPNGSSENYKNADQWSDFVNIEEIELNRFTVADIEVRPGKSFTFPVELINEDAISGFQCDIYLPEGITAELYEDEYDIVLTDRKTSSHSISSALQSDGSIRVAVFSSKSKAFTGNNGAIFEIMLSASEDLQDVTQIAIKNIVLATPDLTQFTPADITANVILKKYILGDANGDETVNITDAVGVVNTILGNEPASFVFDAADVVADGTINITDAIGVVNIILNGQPTTTALAQQPIKATLSATSAGNKFYIEDFSIEAGEEKEIAILLTNDVAFSGFQADIYLPEGLSIYQEDDEYIFDLSSRATRSHSISSALQADGAYRIACFSSSSKDIKENEGELVYFTVIADDDFSGTHTITVKNTIFTQSDLTQYNLEETTATVTGPNIQAIEDIIADEDANAPVEYYNMQGIRVENPQNGIFIRRQGKKVEKVILK